MPFVLDASVSGGWLLDERRNPTVELAWERLRLEAAWVPSIWWYEIRNLLIIAERRKRISTAEVNLAWERIGELRIELDADPDEKQMLALARRHTLSFYDTAYLEVAQRRRCPIATTDGALARAAAAERIPLIGDQA